MRNELVEQIKEFVSFNNEEENDRLMILDALENEPNLFYRENKPMHMTASCFIVNEKKDKVLMCYHRIYNSWSWLGGHADGQEDLLQVALKEAKEESGLKHIVPLKNDIFSLEVLTVDGHYKKGNYVSSHLHLNVTYLLKADENETLRIKEDENSNLAWFTLEDALKASSEPWFVEHIYTKLNLKIEKWRKENGITSEIY